MPEFLFFAVFIMFAVGQPLTRRWVARRWADGRLGNLSAVLILLGTSGVGLGLLLLVGMVILHPSPDAIPAVGAMLFFTSVVFGFAMTAATYASSHGVREHLRAQRAKQDRSKG